MSNISHRKIRKLMHENMANHEKAMANHEKAIAVHREELEALRESMREAEAKAERLHQKLKKESDEEWGKLRRKAAC